MSVAESIVLGVVSGIITSFLLWALINIFNKVVIPWYQALVYKGINIEGVWEISINNPLNKEYKRNGYHNIVNLKQQGHNITGEVIITIQPSGEKLQDPKILVLKGIFSNNDLVLSYQCKDKRKLGVGTYVLKIKEDGKKLEGLSTFVSSAVGDIVSIEQFWTRKKST